jgi:uncharacterized circularly permuted ATP-grasp superfamily protein/uncharacterized alpha-E superfamily protein
VPVTAEPTRSDSPADDRHAAVAGYAARRGRADAVPGGPAPLDELVGPDGQVHAPLRDLAASIDVLGATGLLTRRAQARRFVEDDGVTYGARTDRADGDRGDGDDGGQGDGGEPASTPVRRWALDPLPLVLAADEWGALETALAERAMLLDAVLADLYGPRDLLRQGVVPAEVVLGHPGYLRPADQVRLPSARQLFLTATDLGRGPDGQWLVLADRTQAPSGAGYAMENRRVVSRVLPGLYRDTPLERLREFFHIVRAALQEAAPQTTEPPRVVLLTPGAGTETAFDQAFLATLLGFPLVEGQDLTVREGRVWMRSVGRLEPVDVVLRRVDAWFCDPLELRPDSRLGVPGLLEASRLGTVSVVNPLGAGVLENPGLLPYLAAAGRMLLGSEPSLGSAPTYWCGERTSRRHVLAALDRLVLKPIGRDPGRGSLFGWELSARERDDVRRRIEARPAAWCGQEPVETSTAPVVTSRGLEARHLVLRAFAVAQGGGYRLMSGGLARVAGRSASRFVSSSDGALAKDVWVLSPETGAGSAGRLDGVADRLTLVAPTTVEPALAPRVAEDLFWLGRYAERAEGTARLLRVVDDLAEDHGRRPATPGGQALAVLLAAIGQVTGTARVAAPGVADQAARGQSEPPHAELLRLAVDTSRPGTLGYAVRRTNAVAQAVREQLSLDTWLVLGSLERVLHELADRADAAGPGDDPALAPTLARVLEGLLALAGLGAESMVRDLGWYFMDLGRRLERALNLLALLRATLVHPHGAAVGAVVHESVLVTAESVITFRRRHPDAPRSRSAAGGGSAAQVAGVLDLLLLDRSNPRALAYQLDRAETDLTRISPLDGLGRDATLDRALRAVGARLREADPIVLARAGDGRRGPLATLLDTLAGELGDLAVAVEAAHFVHAAPLRPMPIATPGWQA